MIQTNEYVHENAYFILLRCTTARVKFVHRLKIHSHRVCNTSATIWQRSVCKNNIKCSTTYQYSKEKFTIPTKVLVFHTEQLLFFKQCFPNNVIIKQSRSFRDPFMRSKHLGEIYKFSKFEKLTELNRHLDRVKAFNSIFQFEALSTAQFYSFLLNEAFIFR